MDITVYILIFIAGGFSGYLASYFKQKGINRALKEDNKELENQKKGNRKLLGCTNRRAQKIAQLGH